MVNFDRNKKYKHDYTTTKNYGEIHVTTKPIHCRNCGNIIHFIPIESRVLVAGLTCDHCDTTNFYFDFTIEKILTWDKLDKLNSLLVALENLE